MAKIKNKAITSKHYLTFAEAITNHTGLTAYGKVIADTEIDAGAAGLVHPRAGGGSLQKAVVYGIALDGKCIHLPQPREVLLPEPDGPADGCGWDSSEFVEWRNLPRTWPTLSFETRSSNLLSAILANASLQAAAPSAAAPALVTTAERVVGIVKKWVQMAADPVPLDQLQALWAAFNGNAAFYAPPDVTGAKLLAQSMNSAFPALNLQPSDLDPAGNIKTVQDLINAA